MAEIRDWVIKELVSLTYQSCIDAGHRPCKENDYLPLAEEILSIKEIAIVDREVELPALEIEVQDENTAKFIEENREMIKMIASMMGTTMVSQGWVKEIKGKKEIRD